MFREGAAIGYGGRVVEVMAHFSHFHDPVLRTQFIISSEDSRFSSAIPARFVGLGAATN